MAFHDARLDYNCHVWTVMSWDMKKYHWWIKNKVSLPITCFAHPWVTFNLWAVFLSWGRECSPSPSHHHNQLFRHPTLHSEHWSRCTRPWERFPHSKVIVTFVIKGLKVNNLLNNVICFFYICILSWKLLSDLEHSSVSRVKIENKMSVSLNDYDKN